MELFPFQQVAVDKFLTKRHCLLGDDMGLGKTVTAIELDKRRREVEAYHNKRDPKSMKTLVVTLKSMLGSWEEHFATWNPALRVEVVDPKQRQSFVNACLAGTADVYICHWDILRLVPELQNRKWLHIIADETHKIKNRKAQVSQALKKIPADYKLAMSGTWADNKPDDAWSILNWLYPKHWSSYWRFFNHYVINVWHNKGACSCGGFHKSAYREMQGVADAEGLQESLRPFYVRRRKEEVLKDLPQKMYSTVTVDLTPQQRRAYDEMRTNMLAWVGRHEDEPIAAPVVIARLTRLQQFAVAYGQLETKIRRYKDCEYCQDLPKCQGHEVTVLGLSEPSSKLDAVMDIIESSNEPIVVFGQSSQVVEMLAQRLKTAKITHCTLTGKVSASGRTKIIGDFQEGKYQVFIGTTAAGGVGITLTYAATIIFIDRLWSPSLNKQAEDRVHRIGQERPVHIIDIVASDTLDRGKLQQIQLKWSWIKEVLGDTTN